MLPAEGEARDAATYSYNELESPVTNVNRLKV